MFRGGTAIPLDYVLRQIYKKVEEAVLNHECKTKEEVEFLDRYIEASTEERLSIAREVIKSQSRVTAEAMTNKKTVKWFNIGRFEVKPHDQIIHDLTIETAKELGYTNLEAIKGTSIIKGIKKIVNKKRKSLLQEQYWLRKKLHRFTSPAVFVHDFRKGEALKIREQ